MSLKSFKDKYSVPVVSDIEGFYFSLDGGGRELIAETLHKHNIKLMVEVGSFLCGSTIQWLDMDDQLQIIGVDPWTGDWASILDRYIDNPVFETCWAKISDRQSVVDSVRKHGPWMSSMANVQDYRDRFFPVQARSPEFLYTLKEEGVVPDLMYFDNDKTLEDLNVAHELFPNAILSGDDWRWGADQGFPVQKAVNDFCKRMGFEVEARRATWVLTKK